MSAGGRRKFAIFRKVAKKKRAQRALFLTVFSPSDWADLIGFRVFTLCYTVNRKLSYFLHTSGNCIEKKPHPKVRPV